MLEPWRNTYAHLAVHVGWERFLDRYADSELAAWLHGQPLEVLATMLARRLNAPASSSCGRLFDAVAGALDVSRAGVGYEGQAAIELEALAVAGEAGYLFALVEAGDAEPLLLDPAPMWRALLDDLDAGVARARIAGRFHAGLADAVAGLAARLATTQGTDRVALSGGVMQNRTLFEGLVERLHGHRLTVLAHRQVPANDGGLALGQAVIAAAQGLAARPNAN